MGVNGLAAMALLQLGLQREKAGRVGILNNSIVIFTYIFQVSLTDDQGYGLTIFKANFEFLEIQASYEIWAKLKKADRNKGGYIFEFHFSL